jgi:hypothetical protein
VGLDLQPKEVGQASRQSDLPIDEQPHRSCDGAERVGVRFEIDRNYATADPVEVVGAAMQQPLRWDIHRRIPVEEGGLRQVGQSGGADQPLLDRPGVLKQSRTSERIEI